MISIRSNDQLYPILFRLFKKVIDDVSREVHKNLSDTIDKVVYGAGDPVAYDRQPFRESFKGSFIHSNSEIRGNNVESELYHDPFMMTEHESGNTEDFIHGSEFWGITDIRSLLAEIIAEGKSGDLFGEGYWTEERDFWTPVVDFLKTPKADAIVEESMTRHGITWKKI